MGNSRVHERSRVAHIQVLSMPMVEYLDAAERALIIDLAGKSSVVLVLPGLCVDLCLSSQIQA